MQPFAWEENVKARTGPGISRPFDSERTREFLLMVVVPGSQPMKWRTKAANPTKAKQYALARWPGANVIVLK
jgi:hypothetical protein